MAWKGCKTYQIKDKWTAKQYMSMCCQQETIILQIVKSIEKKIKTLKIKGKLLTCSNLMMNIN